MQVMIEGAGHVPINQLEHHARWQEICLKGRMLYSSLGSVKPTPSSVGRGTAPPLPRLSGGPRWIWAPRALRSASYMRCPGNAEPSRAPTYIDAKRAERLVLLSRASAAGRPRRRSADTGRAHRQSRHAGCAAIARTTGALRIRAQVPAVAPTDRGCSPQQVAHGSHTPTIRGTCTAHMRITSRRAV